MKNLYKLAWAVLPLALLVSCSKEHSDGQGGNAIPQVTFSSLSDKGTSDADGLRTFSVEATGTSGDVLKLDLVSNLTFLPSGSYHYGTAAANYAYMNASYNGETLSGGTFTVTRGDNDNYTISGLVTRADGSLFDCTASGTLHYEVSVDPQHKIWYSGEYNDGYGGEFWLVYILSNDLEVEAQLYVCNAKGSTTPEGTYSCGGLQDIKPGAYMEGFDYSFIGFGKLGCYFVKDGAEYYVHDGTIEISEEFGYLSVKMSGLTVKKNDAEDSDIKEWNAQYCETIAELPQPDKPEVPELPEEIMSFGCYYTVEPQAPDEEAGTTEYYIYFNAVNQADYSKGDALGQVAFIVPSDQDMNNLTGSYDNVSMGIDITSWVGFECYIGSFLYYDGAVYFVSSAESFNINIGEDYTTTSFELINPVLRDASGNEYTGVKKVAYYYVLSAQ